MKIEVDPEKTKKERKYLGGFLTNDLGQKLDKTEKSLIRTAVGLAILLVVIDVARLVADATSIAINDCMLESTVISLLLSTFIVPFVILYTVL